jgi:hypothetical protein
MIFGFFGFFRNGHNHKTNIDFNNQHDVYIYTPTIRNENLYDDYISPKMIVDKIGKDANILIYSYNKELQLNKQKKLNIPKFNSIFQPIYRIFSFFYNIKKVLEMVKESNKYKADDIIVLSRIDIGLNLKTTNIESLLDKNDIILGVCTGYGTDDKCFIFKYKNIDVFISLYDDCDRYFIDYYDENIKIDLPRMVPEEIFMYHFINKGMKCLFTGTDIIEYSFEHVCSEFCGHNGVNTKF